jgi:hypothetical protein
MTGQIGTLMRLAVLGRIGSADVYTEQVPGQGGGWPWCSAGEFDGRRLLADTGYHHDEQQHDDQGDRGYDE